MNATDMQPGYILQHRQYRDTSVLLELFTPQSGRVGLVARGARTAKSRYRGVLQPFQPLLCSWGGRGELGTLRQAEVVGRPFALRDQPLYAAYYLNELILRLTRRHDPHPEIFQAYSDALGELATGTVEAILRRFEKRTLDALGYALILDRDIEGRAIDSEARYRYLPEQGPKRLADIDAFETGISGRSLLALLHDREPGAEELRDLKRLMRSVLSAYIGERPLKTRQFIMTMTSGEASRRGQDDNDQ